MRTTTVMQHATHTPADRPRFFVSARGVLMDRQGHGPARRLPYSMERNFATRSEMQLLADMLNEPGPMRDFDAGSSPDWAWAQRIAQREQDMRHGIISAASHTGEWQRFVIAEACHGA